MDSQKRDEDRERLVADVERLCAAVRGVEMPAGDREAVLALLGDLRAILARSEASAPRLRGVLDAQARDERPTSTTGRGWRAGWR